MSIQGSVLQPFDEYALVYDLLPEWCLGQPLVELKLVIAVWVCCLFRLRRELLGLVLRAWRLGQPLVELKLVITYAGHSYDSQIIAKDSFRC